MTGAQPSSKLAPVRWNASWRRVCSDSLTPEGRGFESRRSRWKKPPSRRRSVLDSAEVVVGGLRAFHPRARNLA